MRSCPHLFRVVAGLLAILPSGASLAEIKNHFAPIPPGGANCFTFVFNGNEASAINTSSTATDPMVNPFAYLGIQSCVSTSYNPACNTTTVTICGASPITPGETFSYPPGNPNSNGEPHFGVDGGNTLLPLATATWSNQPNACSTGSARLHESKISDRNDSASPRLQKCVQQGAVASAPATSLPQLSISTTQTGGPNPVYYTLYLGTSSNGSQIGTWYQQQYPSGTTPVFNIVNNTSASITITSVGFILNDSKRSLDSLNFGELAPPGYTGSPFSIPNPSLNGTVISAGGSISAPTH